MSTDNQESNVNPAFALLNKNVLDFYKSQYPQLAEITCSNNVLVFHEESFQLGYFRLNQINVMICELPAKDFFRVVRLLADIENNLAFEDAYFYSINELIMKPTLNEQDKNNIIDFVEKYLALKQYEDFLTGSSAVTLSKYRQVVNNVLYLSDPNNLTEAQKHITDRVLAESEAVGGRGSNLSRTLKNPDVPNMSPNEDTGYSKAGFASIILILYTIINAAIMLAIHLIK